MKVVLTIQPDRVPPNYVHAETIEQAIDLLSTFTVNEFIVDQDLGKGKGTGSLALIWIRKKVQNKRFIPPTIKAHADHPDDLLRMRDYVREIYMSAPMVLTADLTLNKTYKVCNDALHHKGRIGVLKFMAGEKRKTIAVLAQVGMNSLVFASRIGDLIPHEK